MQWAKEQTQGLIHFNSCVFFSTVEQAVLTVDSPEGPQVFCDLSFHVFLHLLFKGETCSNFSIKIQFDSPQTWIQTALNLLKYSQQKTCSKQDLPVEVLTAHRLVLGPLTAGNLHKATLYWRLRQSGISEQLPLGQLQCQETFLRMLYFHQHVAQGVIW